MTTVPFRGKTSAATLVSRLKSDPHSPMSAMIEVADRCNEVCVHCYQIQGQKGELSTEEWFGIIDELADLGVLFLTISGGEATLRKDFLELVEHARRRRFAVKLYTNGLTMTRELAARLSALAVQEVQISLYSHLAEVHDWVTRVPGSWEKTVAAARALIEEGVKVVLKTPLMTFNADGYDAYIAFVTSLGADYSLDLQVDAREDGDRGTEQFRLAPETYERLASDPRLKLPSPSGPREKNLERRLCGACSGSVHVEADGELRPCTQLTVPVGNAVRDGVRNALASNENALSIRALTWADLHGCRDCDLQPYCTRCFAVSHVEAGDALGPYPSACGRARVRWEAMHASELLVEAIEGRDAAVGPYRALAPGRFVTAEDVSTDADEARARAHGWIRRAASPAASEPVAPGGLVQIRRPGAKKPGWERVPAGAAPVAPIPPAERGASMGD